MLGAWGVFGGEFPGSLRPSRLPSVMNYNSQGDMTLRPNQDSFEIEMGAPLLISTGPQP